MHRWRYIFRIRYIPSYFYLIPNILANHRELPPSLHHLKMQFTNQNVPKLKKFKNFNKFQNFQNIIKFQNFQESYVIKQLLHLNLINMEKKTQKTQWNVIKQLRYFTACDIIQLMTFHKVDTVIYQPRGSDVHRSQRLRWTSLPRGW